jgi:hypothetical protein
MVAPAVILPVSEEDLEDYVLANAPEFVSSIREADRALGAGRTREAFSFYDELEGAKIAGKARTARRAGSPRPRRRSTSSREGS